MELTDGLCRILDWDSDFFGCRIAQITVNRLNSENMERVMMWCRNHAIQCLYFLADTDDVETTRLAEDTGFHLVDIRVTLEKILDDIPIIRKEPSHGVVRLCKPEDVPALRAIARTSYHDSRFYYDPNFPKHLCDSLYATWIEKSCEGYADAVLVAELEGQPVGYVSCHLLGQREGKIGLVGVSTHSRGKGLGERLMSRSLTWFLQQDVKHVMIVTQGRNCMAQRLYQQLGFLTKSVQLWYHRWFKPMGGMVSE